MKSNLSHTMQGIRNAFHLVVNNYEDIWFQQGQISFIMPQKGTNPLDLCA